MLIYKFPNDPEFSEALKSLVNGIAVNLKISIQVHVADNKVEIISSDVVDLDGTRYPAEMVIKQSIDMVVKTLRK